jgi:type II secretory pathway pseudopilin PulG
MVMTSLPSGPHHRHPVRKRSEAGYNMVMLIVALTVLNIMIAAMMPLMSTEIQREKEEELVFRGFQYAEAIRIFHLRFQRFPNKLEELIEIKPRCIRQLWKDPMTKNGKWGLIFQGQGVPLHPQNPQDPEGRQQPPNANPNDPEGKPGDGQDNNGLNTPKQGDEVVIGPIVGVYSKSPKESHLVFYGHQRYDEWRFTFDLIPNGGIQRPQIAPGIANPGQVLAPNFSTRWLGRPMYLVDQQQSMPQNGTMPGQQPGGGSPGSPPGGGKKPSGRL